MRGVLGRRQRRLGLGHLAVVRPMGNCSGEGDRRSLNTCVEVYSKYNLLIHCWWCLVFVSWQYVSSFVKTWLVLFVGVSDVFFFNSQCARRGKGKQRVPRPEIGVVVLSPTRGTRGATGARAASLSIKPAYLSARLFFFSFRCCVFFLRARAERSGASDGVLTHSKQRSWSRDLPTRSYLASVYRSAPSPCFFHAFSAADVSPLSFFLSLYCLLQIDGTSVSSAIGQWWDGRGDASKQVRRVTN